MVYDVLSHARCVVCEPSTFGVVGPRELCVGSPMWLATRLVVLTSLQHHGGQGAYFVCSCVNRFWAIVPGGSTPGSWLFVLVPVSFE
jgi:hypothetical protein